MEYLSSKQMAEKWDTHIRIVQRLCNLGRVEGAKRFGQNWMIPSNAEKPADKRYKKHKQTDQ
jgi:hypothetical protein